MLRNVVAVVFTASLFTACLAVNNPESPDYPCGPRGLVCSGSYPHATCCWQGDTCGGVDPTCPANYCCWVGDDQQAARGSGEKKWARIRPQWAAK